MSSLARKFAYAAGATSTLAAGCVALERMPGRLDPETRLGNAASTVIAAVRFTRSLHTAAIIMADYRHLFAQHTDYQSPDYKSARSDVHARSADRLLKLARAQGAVYVKIGQHVASMNHAVPPEYSTKLKLLEDRAAYRPFRQISRLLKRELKPGRLSDVYSSIEPTPVAAASLAQVHRATLKDTGETVAVKIQYPGLEALVQGDLTSIRFLSQMLRWVFPFFDMEWVVDQFRSNLQKELNFNLEAQSARRTAAFFKHDHRIVVPSIHDQYSTRRVLTMEYIDGWRVDNIEKMREAGINAHEVSKAVVDTFAQMIFMNGFVHCDPHAGNLMVRSSGKGNGAFELCLLDHGLYRELEDEFRQSYCKLWKGLVLRRAHEVETACEELGASGLENIFAVMLLNRSWKSARRIGTDIRVKMNKEEMSQLRNDLKDSGIKSQADISSFIERIPDDLFLVFKMNALVRNVNKALGASVNRFKVNARFAVRGLRHFNRSRSHHRENRMTSVVACTGVEIGSLDAMRIWFEEVGDWLGQMMDRAFVEIGLLVLDLGFFAVRWWTGARIIDGRSKASGDRTSPPVGGDEDGLNLLG